MTNISTSENYNIETSNIVLNKNSILLHQKPTIITDLENNIIKLENFEYQKEDKIFKSIGAIEITDKLNNSYQFSQLYIDTKKKEIIGTDVSAFMNDKQFKINEKNNPRVMANTFSSSKDQSFFNKSIFTLCGYRKSEDKENVPLGLFKLPK